MIDGIFKDTMADMKWPEIQEAVDQNALVLLPLGVIEEHGPQLCLGTDIYTAHRYCLAVQKLLRQKGYPAVIAPPFYWGVCQSTGGFIGSFQIKKETAKSVLVDILASLAGFGFHNIFGVNAHGDIEHAVAIIEAFAEIQGTLGINARHVFDEWRLPHFGFSGDEPFLCPVKPQAIKVSSAETPDIHAGDIETAMIHAFYPELVDAEKAKSLPPVSLPEEKGEDWLFGGHIHELSAEGYLGSPADFEHVNVEENLKDYACRITEAILKHLS